ncbi:COP9 signalosome complex subunit 7, partial [Lecanoromycetidae sp. Uapishka_2]
MDQTQQKALNALEPFILLSKSANSPRAAADLVTQATSAPNTFVFAELLQTPNIQSLQTASSEYSPYLTLLQIFAWGTWSDYTSTPNLPKFSEPQQLKLRQLSLLTLATTPSNLTYVHLQDALDLPTTRALEDLVISTIYAGLLNAKLDTLSQRVDVSSVAPLRDLKPGSIPQMEESYGGEEKGGEPRESGRESDE